MRNMIPFGSGRNSVFDEMDDVFRGFSEALKPMTRRYVPVEMFEENNEVVVNVDAPGFEPSQIEIKNFSDRVNIRSNVEESSENAEDGRTWYMRRNSRAINLCVTLPTEVDPDGASASFKNGVITIRMPKSRAVQGKVLELRSE